MLRCMLIIAACLWLVGCTAPRPPAPLPPFRDPAMTLQGASQTILPGRTSRDELATSLGPATVVRFAGGFEVWIYSVKATASQPPAGSPAELVVLLDPSGVVKKTRIKPVYPP